MGQSSEEYERMLQLVVQSHRLDTHEHVYIFICSLLLFTLRELSLIKDANIQNHLIASVIRSQLFNSK